MTKSNPWQFIKSREIFDNPWMQVREDEVINPGGTKNYYGKIQFKNQAIGIIPLDDEGNTWLVGQYRYVLGLYSWEIPMGGSPIEEDRLTTAKRELREETGLTANNWSCFLRLHTSNSITDEEAFVYLARELIDGVTEFEDTEVITVKKLPLSEAVRMVLEGEITDAISVAGLLKLTYQNSIGLGPIDI